MNIKGWYDALETFLGTYDWPNILTPLSVAIERLRPFPQATQLLEVIDRNQFYDRKDLARVLLFAGTPEFTCYAGVMLKRRNLIDDAAQKGNMYAKGLSNDNLAYLLEAATYNDRNALYDLYYLYGYDLSYLKHAAELGHITAMCHYEQKLSATDHLRYHFIEKILQHSHTCDLFETLTQIVSCNSTPSHIVSIIGRLKIDTTCIHCHYKHVHHIKAPYKIWCVEARATIHAWSLCARRLGLHKDIVPIISRLVWNLMTYT